MEEEIFQTEESESRKNYIRSLMNAIAIILLIIGSTSGYYIYQATHYQPQSNTKRIKIQHTNREQAKKVLETVQLTGGTFENVMSRQKAIERARSWVEEELSIWRGADGTVRPWTSTDSETGEKYPIEMCGLIYMAYNLPMQMELKNRSQFKEIVNPITNPNGGNRNPFRTEVWPSSEQYFPVSCETIRYVFTESCHRNDVKPGDLLCDYGFCSIITGFNTPTSYEDAWNKVNLIYISPSEKKALEVYYDTPFSVNQYTKEYWIWSNPQYHCFFDSVITQSSDDSTYDEPFGFDDIYKNPEYVLPTESQD